MSSSTSTDPVPAASPSEITINVKAPSEKLQVTISTDKTVADLKRVIAEKSDVPAENQRLIFSGRILKDEDVLSTYKIASSNTIHMVRGAARSGPSAQQQAAPQQLPAMHAGQNPHDPLTQLNGQMGFGLMAGFNPFAEMGLNPNDPNMMQTMLNSPHFLQQMSSVMSNPEVLDQVINSNPQLAAMGPQVREVFRSERFRQMMSNPETLRMMLQMSNMMRESGLAPPGAGGMGGFGAGARGGGFPAPGLPSTARQQQPQPGATPGATPQPGTEAGAANPFGFGFNPFLAGANPWGTPPAGAAGGADAGAGAGAGAAGAGALPSPNAMNPALMQQMLAALGGGAGANPFGGAGANPFGASANPFGGLGGFGAPAAPADTRPPEERFQVQLQQLQDMGFTNASQNVRALLATGGNVHSAIEYILGGGGL